MSIIHPAGMRASVSRHVVEALSDIKSKCQMTLENTRGGPTDMVTLVVTKEQIALIMAMVDTMQSMGGK